MLVLLEVLDNFAESLFDKKIVQGLGFLEAPGSDQKVLFHSYP